MKLKLEQMYRAYPVISKIINQEMPIKIAFQLSKLAKKINEEYAEIEKQRMSLVKKYGTEPDEKQVIKVKEEDAVLFFNEWRDFLNTESEIDCEKINIDILPEEIKLSPQDLQFIDFLIEKKKN